MPWKRDSDGPRGRGRRTDIMNAIRSGERTILVTLSKFVVVLLFLLFAIIATAGDSVLVAALAGVGVFLTAKLLLPTDTITNVLKWFRDGGAGKWVHNSYLRIMPGRKPDDRRGQTNPIAILVLVLIIAFVASLAVSGVALAEEENETATVEHDYLSDESYVQEFEETSTVESTDRNVRTKIKKTDAFVRLTAENPNAYPVEMTVKVHPDIVPAAEVGDVTSADGETTSTWRNVHDFESDQSYTEITFTIDAESELVFAPSRIRVLAISWKDKSSDPDGLVDRITAPLENSDLEERTYDINSSQGSMVTVPLQNGDRSIDDWRAVYRTGPDDNWKPVTMESSDPAFYRTVDGGNAVQFHFDTDDYEEGDVEIKFTANPTFRDRVEHDYRSLMSGFKDIIDGDLFSALALPIVSEVSR